MTLLAQLIKTDHMHTKQLETYTSLFAERESPLSDRDEMTAHVGHINICCEI
jgi:hypothetical protein